MTSGVLIPRETLFGNPDHMGVQLSPDGHYISFVAPFEGVMNLWVGDALTPENAQPITQDKKRGIQNYSWTYAPGRLLYLQDTEGDESWVVYCLDLKTKKATPLTPSKGVNGRIEKLSQKFPQEAILSHNGRNPQFHDLYRVNLETGKEEMFFQNDQYVGIDLDHQFSIRFGMQTTPAGGTTLFRMEAGAPQEIFAEFGPEDALHSGVVGFNKENDVLYMTDSRDRDTAALYTYDLKTAERTLVGKDDRADVADILLHPTEKTIQAFAVNYDRKRWTFFDPEIEKAITCLSALEDGDVEIVSRSLDDQKWIVAYLLDNQALRYYFFDRARNGATFLFSNRSDLEDLTLSKMQPQEIKARDGLNLVSYLSLPVEMDPEGTGRPTQPLPLVLYVHGGPHARDSWGYNPIHQWLTNRGYGVLSVNYRGSVGFGKRFTAAGNGEWGAKMHDDLIDAVQWAIDQGIADPEKVAIMGGSYGGYATLVGLTMTPDVFACGVDIVGPSNLNTLIRSFPEYWKPVIDMMKVMVGADHETEEGQAFLKSRSPLTHVDQIKKPLLIGQGANDPRVKQAESDQIVNAMTKKNIPVTYVIYPDEGHGFVRPENRLSFYGITESFLSKILDGRFEPIRDFKGSSIEIKTGLEYISGIPQTT